MKTATLAVLSIVLALAPAAWAETIHQTLAGSKAHTSDGGSAVDKKLLEVKEEPKADNKEIARLKGDLQQWGFVTYWFGVAAPAGKSTIRIHVYVDAAPPAGFAVYVIPSGGGQKMVGKIQIPADAKPGTFVNIDIPVDSQSEWSGAAVKKFEKSDKPGPWIDSISVVLP